MSRLDVDAEAATVRGAVRSFWGWLVGAGDDQTAGSLRRSARVPSTKHAPARCGCFRTLSPRSQSHQSADRGTTCVIERCRSGVAANADKCAALNVASRL
jgi:hypothetical protein